MKFERVVYAGHSAVFLEAKDFVMAIDPWLEGNPRCPSALKNPARLDLMVLTHGHSDHAGDAVRLAKHYGCAVAATFELAMILIGQGVSGHQVHPMNKGGSITHAGLSITLTHAYHSSSYDTASGPVYAGEPCGVVVRDSSRAFYHAGDTALFSDMSLIKETYRPEIAFLPIGDRFTMGPREAARAAVLVGCKTAIPIHYATFDMLTGTPEELRKHAQGFDVVALEPGEKHELSRS